MGTENTRDLIVTDLKELATGTSKRGTPYVLYQVRATYPDGRVIPDMKLRTFEQLPLNEVIKVRIEVAESEQFGRSYTLFQVGGERKSAGEALVETVEQLKSRVSALERAVRENLGVAVSGPQESQGRSSNIRVGAPIGPPMPDPTPPPIPGEGSGDSAPF